MRYSFETGFEEFNKLRQAKYPLEQLEVNDGFYMPAKEDAPLDDVGELKRLRDRLLSNIAYRKRKGHFDQGQKFTVSLKAEPGRVVCWRIQ